MRVNRFTVFILAAICFLPLFFNDNPIITGMSVKIINNSEYAQGGTSLWSIATSISLFLIYLLVLDEKEIKVSARSPKYLRRFWALFIDFFIGMVMISGIIGIIPAIYESIRIQKLTLNFERNTVLSSDWAIITFCFILLIILLLFYLAYPIIKDRQTFGLFFTGMKIISSDNERVTLKQVLLRWVFVFIAISVLPFTLIIGRDSDGLFWHEKYSNSKIVLTDQVE